MRYIPKYYDLFDDMFDTFAGDRYNSLMKTDIKEKDGNYELDVELPGYKKEDVKVDLKDGYLTISANRSNENEEKDNEGKIIRQERYSGSLSRSFYVGDDMKVEDIKAKFDNGILYLTLPSQERKQIEERKYITIE